MRVAIIGHGPSLLKSYRWAAIDAHDLVVRIKRSWQLPAVYPQHYGRKTDHVCGSLKIADALVQGWREHGVNSWWVFDDSRTYGKGYKVPDGAYCDSELCKRWRDVYLQIRKPITLDPLQSSYEGLSDECGHLHQSAGSHAIMYTMELLKPDAITLYGFDSLASGTFTWSVTRGIEWTKYPDHNWQAEAEVLSRMAEHYGYSVTKRIESGTPEVLLERVNAA